MVVEKQPITAIDLSHIYDEMPQDQNHSLLLGEFPVGVSINSAIASEQVIRTDADFEHEIATNQELIRRAKEFDGVIAVERKSPNKLNIYFAEKLHQITENKTKAVAVGLGVAGAVATIYVVQHEIRKHRVTEGKEKKEINE